jgi:CheY-like chemotaxis protein
MTEDRSVDLARSLLAALAHLHDPDYRAPEAIRLLLGWSPGRPVRDVQATLLAFLQELAPDENDLPADRADRPFEVLHARYVQQLTQEETAEHLHLSLRTVQREQHKGVHLLLRRLQARSRITSGNEANQLTPPQGANWRQQLEREVGWLRRHEGDANAPLRETLSAALPLARKCAAAYGAEIIVEGALPDCHVQLHPSALRQLVLAAVSELGQCAAREPIRLAASVEGDRLTIALACGSAAAKSAENPTGLHDLARALGADLRVQSPQPDGSPHATWLIVAPLVQDAPSNVRVLAIDDNLDLVRLYQSYCQGTPYEIEHLLVAEDVFNVVDHHKPDLILLDVLLPHVDGWDLLLDLHAHQATRDIPIIVCSVITEEALALSLGATLYLQKPVWRAELISAFETALRTGAHKP